MAHEFDWSDVAFGSKKSLNELGAIFIAAPRELSQARFRQLIKTYLPKGNIVIGLAKEDYVLGFENQPQFKMLKSNTIEEQINKINNARLAYTVSLLHYFQRDLDFILRKLNFQKVVFINGSWKQLFHTLPTYHTLTMRRIPYDMVSPFTNEAEAMAYATSTPLAKLPAQGWYSELEMLEIARQAAQHSYDYGFQAGVSLGRSHGKKYALLATSFNRVVPFQTYAMHYGALREQHFSPMNDLNHYDTVHAEVKMIVKAQKQKIDLHRTTLFINLLPCPSCARMFTLTDINEFVYSIDHSDGYAVKMLEKAGKKVRRLV